MREENSIEAMNLEKAIEVLKVHKVNETDHYRDCGIVSRALEIAIKCLERENNKSFEEKNEELMDKYLTKKADIQDIINTAHYWQDKYLNLLERLETKLREEIERLNNHIGTFYKDSFTNRTIRTLEDILKEVDKKGI